jgi:hypothetical protein
LEYEANVSSTPPLVQDIGAPPPGLPSKSVNADTVMTSA